MPHESPNERKGMWLVATQYCAAFILVICTSAPAFAQCSVDGGGSPGSVTVALPTSLSTGRDSTVGAILYDSGWVATPSVRATCTGGGNIQNGYVNSIVAVQGMSNVFKTGVEGVGVKAAWWPSTQGGPSNIDGAAVMSYPMEISGRYGAGVSDYMGNFRVQLIKTGQVLPGSFTLPGKLASGMYGTAEINVLRLSNNSAPVVAPACTVVESAISVTMPTGKVRDMTTVGSTTGDTGFTIAINCPSPVSVSMTMTDAANHSNVSNILSLSTGSTAKGVAYQILYNKVAINFGLDSPDTKNPNQFMVGPAGTVGVLSIPFAARYVRTGPITPGTANANATFTMSYQ